MTEKNLSFQWKNSNSFATSNYLTNRPQAGVKKLPKNVLTEQETYYPPMTFITQTKAIQFPTA